MNQHSAPIRSIFPSGLRIITHKTGKKGIMAGHIRLTVGTAHATKINPRFMGLPHFNEHMVHNGESRNYRADQVRTEISEALFFDPNAISGMFDTHHLANFSSNGIIGQVFPVRNFWQAFEAVADGVFFPKYDQATLERERARILNEISENQTQLRKDNARFYAQLFGVDYMGFDGLGTREQVIGYNRNDLIAFQDITGTLRNTVIVVTGDVEHQEAISRIEKILSDVPKGHTELPSLKRGEVQQGEFRRQTDGANEGLVEASLHFPAPDVSHKEFHGTLLAAPALSRIISDAVQNRFGAYSTWLSYKGWLTPLPSVQLTVKTGEKAKAADALAFAVEVMQDPKTMELLEQKHDKLIGRRINDIEVFQPPLQEMTSGIHLYNDLNIPFFTDEESIAQYKRVSPADIAMAVTRLNTSLAFLEVRGHHDALDAIPSIDLVEAWRSKPSEPLIRTRQPANFPHHHPK
ncbi:MAG: M16 family metallopeptidase [Bdellovibrionales bacterium]